MAVDQDLLDDIAATVANLYAELESALNKQIADRLGEDLDSPYQITKLDAVGKLRRSAQLLIATLDATRSKVVRDAIARAYRDGYGSALTDIPEQHFPNSGIGRRARQATDTIPNAPVIENIAQSLHRDLGDVSGNILRNVLDAYRSVQAAAAARIVAGVDTRRQAAQALWQRLVDKGVTSFTDTAGRRWKLSSYAEMATRTNAARAAVQGQTDRLGTVGVHLVVVSDHGQECKLCRPFEGKILSLNGVTGRIQVQHATRDGHMVTVNVLDTLDGARRKGFQHPNCRHSVSAYTPGITEQPTGTADPEGDTARQRQREIERNIRKHKERAATALTPEAKKLAEAKTREWQKAMRDHLAANPKLKRLRYREQPGAGNTPGAGGPKGGPVGDLEPPRQPTLDDGPGAQRPTPQAEQTSPPARPNAGQQNLLDQPKTETPKPKAVSPAPKAPSKPVVKPKAKKPKRDAAEFHRNLDGIEDLADAVDNGFPPRERRNLTGGMSADTELLTLKGGKKVVFKNGGNPDAEQAASKIAAALGLRAPRVYRDHPSSVYMDYIHDGRTAGDLQENDPAEWQKRNRKMSEHDDGYVVGLLDLLIGNSDRNTGNWLVTENGRVIPIDHGHAFGAVPHSGPIRVKRPTAHGPFADNYKVGEPNPLTQADIEEVRRRLEALRPDFQHIGRERWLDYALKVLDILAQDAHGPWSQIAGVR